MQKNRISVKGYLLTEITTKDLIKQVMRWFGIDRTQAEIRITYGEIVSVEEVDHGPVMYDVTLTKHIRPYGSMELFELRPDERGVVFTKNEIQRK